MFAVIQKDSSAPLALPRTEADAIAAEIPDKDYERAPNAERLTGTPGVQNPYEGFKDVDLELERALQASLGDPMAVLPHLAAASAPRRRPVARLLAYPKQHL